MIVNRIKLSKRELEVLKYLVKGDSNPKIAEKLFISTNTVKAHCKSIYYKFGVNSRVEAVVRALQEGYYIWF